MKIARQPRMLASTWVNGAVPPAPSLRELSSEARLRECTSVNVKAQKFQSQQWLTDNHWPGTTIERHSLSHALASVPAPSEREPGGAVPFIRPPGNRDISGDFHRPYESSEEFTFYHSSDDTPSASHLLSSSLREGAGKGCTIQPGTR